MKKNVFPIISVLFFACIFTNANAQMIAAPNSRSTGNNAKIGNTNLNLRFGINVSSLVVNDDPAAPEDFDIYHGRLGFHFGINSQLPINAKSSLDISVLFSQRGANIEHTDNSSGINTGIEGFMKMSYLEIPLFYSYHLPINGKIINLMAGPTIGIGLNGKYEIDQIFGTSRTPFNGDIEFNEISISNNGAAMKRIDIGLNFGASTAFKNIVAGLNYNFGLTNHIYNPGDGEYMRQRAFQVFVNYPLPNRIK